MDDDTIDRPAFAQLLGEVGPEVMARLLAAFAREANARIARFAELSEASSPLGEGSELHREVHSLKSAAASFGAAALAKRADALETAVETRQYDHDPAAAADLAALFGRFSDAVAAHRHAPETP
jgi:HPt (histidine-containing phosphotransfer) domain-containing protein